MVTVVVTVGRSIAAVWVWVWVFVMVVVLHIDTVFAVGAGQTLTHAGQIRLLAAPFSHEGRPPVRRKTVGALGTPIVDVEVTTVAEDETIVIYMNFSHRNRPGPTRFDGD
jgi:hypothetical protein